MPYRIITYRLFLNLFLRHFAMDSKLWILSSASIYVIDIFIIFICIGAAAGQPSADDDDALSASPERTSPSRTPVCTRRTRQQAPSSSTPPRRGRPARTSSSNIDDVPSTERYRFSEEGTFQSSLRLITKRRFTLARGRILARLIVEDLLWHATGGLPVPSSAGLFYEGMYLFISLLFLKFGIYRLKLYDVQLIF